MRDRLQSSRHSSFTVVHSSDVHVDDDYAAAQFGGDGARQLGRVVQTAARLGADLLLLVGDTFDHNRLPERVVARAAALLAEFPNRILVLPGNHDPAMEDSVFHHPAFRALERVQILGVTCGETLYFAEFDLEVWGRPHRDFGDMAPLASPPERRALWRIALAHGHYEPEPDRAVWPRPAWLFGDDELAACGADYVALGHWNRAARVGRGPAPAWYSGSPDVAQTVNLLRFGPDRRLAVAREPLPTEP